MKLGFGLGGANNHFQGVLFLLFRWKWNIFYFLGGCDAGGRFLGILRLEGRFISEFYEKTANQFFFINILV